MIVAFDGRAHPSTEPIWFANMETDSYASLHLIRRADGRTKMLEKPASAVIRTIIKFLGETTGKTRDAIIEKMISAPFEISIDEPTRVWIERNFMAYLEASMAQREITIEALYRMVDAGVELVTHPDLNAAEIDALKRLYSPKDSMTNRSVVDYETIDSYIETLMESDRLPFSMPHVVVGKQHKPLSSMLGDMQKRIDKASSLEGMSQQ